MAFNIQSLPYLYPENIKKIIAIGISLRDTIENFEKGLIAEYMEDKTYTPGTSTYYDSYLWLCKYTTSGPFDSTKWVKIGDDLTLITKDNIKTMIGLSQEQLDTLVKIIDDSQIMLNKTWSGSKIYTEIQNAIAQGEQFTLGKLANTMTASFKIANNTADMTERNILYLLSIGTNSYEIYALISGVPTPIASTTIDLSEYVKQTDLADYLKIVDADGKYATIVSLITHEDDEDIHTSVIEKANYVKKASIVTTIDNTVTNGQLIDGKTLVDKFTSINNKLSLRYNFDSISYKSYSGRKSAIKNVINTLKKDGVTDSEADYYENNSIFIIRYNGEYYFTYIMTTYYSKVFILEFSVHTDAVNIWCEDEVGELYLKGTIPITLNAKHFINPFTLNHSNYKLYDGYYTISGKTCTLTVSIDCISPTDSAISVGSLANLNLKVPSTTRTVDLKAEDDENNVMCFYVDSSECQAWLGTAGKRYTGTFTYTIE